MTLDNNATLHRHAATKGDAMVGAPVAYIGIMVTHAVSEISA
jgi:hypothetical protein